MKIEKIFQEGVLVDLDVSVWSGQATLRPEDLKIKPEDVPDIFRLGKKLLVSKKALEPIRIVERHGREILRTWAFSFPIGGARFVPRGSIGVVIDRLEEMKTQFQARVEEFLGNYETFKQEMLTKYEAYREALEEYYPQPEVLRTKFAFRFTIYMVELPEGNGNISEEHRNALRDRMTSFVDEVAIELRKQTAALFTKVAAKVAKGQIVRAETFLKMKQFIDRFELMNFLSDQEVAQRLRRLKSMIDGIDEASVEHPEFQSSLYEALSDITKAADNITDVDAVTGEFKRRILLEE